MAHRVQKGNDKSVRVAICGDCHTVFTQYQHELQDLGYYLSLEPKVTDTDDRAFNSDIYIINMSELETAKQSLHDKKRPFLIYGIKDIPKNEQAASVFYDAVGYFIEAPSAENICLTIQLGLHHHREREEYLKRTQSITEKIENNRLNGVATGLLMGKTGLSADHIFDEIKAISRHKQQRVAHVANEIIQVLSSGEASTERKMGKAKPIRHLTRWLEENIFSKNNQQ
jgi:hypothetical protein